MTTHTEMIRKRVWELLEAVDPKDKISRVVEFFIAGLIVLNVLAVILESVTWIERDWRSVFESFEAFSIVFFSVEYLLRLWSCVSTERFRAPIRGRIRYILSAGSLIDLVAICPSLLLFGQADMRIARLMRLVRILALAQRTGHLGKSIRMFIQIISAKKDELWLSFSLLLTLLVVTSSLVYGVEHEVQPEAFSNIPTTMWWAIATLTTVGYGDMTPISPWGRVFGSITAVVGVAFFALPTAILAAGFFEERQKDDPPVNRCPHCGKVPQDPPNEKAGGAQLQPD